MTAELSLEEKDFGIEDWGGVPRRQYTDEKYVEVQPNYGQINVIVREAGGYAFHKIEPPAHIRTFEPDEFIDYLKEAYPVGLVGYEISRQRSRESFENNRVYLEGELASARDLWLGSTYKTLRKSARRKILEKGAMDYINLDGNLVPLHKGDVLVYERFDQVSGKYRLEVRHGRRVLDTTHDHDYTGGTHEFRYWSDGSEGTSSGSVNPRAGTYYFWNGETDIRGKFRHWNETNILMGSNTRS